MLDSESPYKDNRASAIREETEDEEQESTISNKGSYKVQAKNKKSIGRYNHYDDNVVTDDVKIMTKEDLYSDDDHKA